MARARKTPAPAAKPGKPAAGDVFAAADARSHPERPAESEGAAPRRNGTTLPIPSSYPNEIHDAVRSFRESAVQIKSAKAQAEAAEEDLLPVALELLSQVWATEHKRPPGPIEMESRDGQKVTFVLSDRTGNYRVTDELHAALVKLLGPQVETLLRSDDVYELSQAVLAEPGVKQAISAALQSANLTRQQRDQLLVHTRLRRFPEKCLEKLASLAGSGPKILELLTLLRAAATRHLAA